MSRVQVVMMSAATLVVMGVSSIASPAAQKPAPGAGRTEKGLYLLKVVEPGYDVTVKETERAPTFSALEMNGLVPTVTAGGMILFKAMYDVAKERKFEYIFSPPPAKDKTAGGTSAGPEGRRVAMVTKMFLTNDPKASLKTLLGADYTAEAQRYFDEKGYQSVAQLALMFGGR